MPNISPDTAAETRKEFEDAVATVMIKSAQTPTVVCSVGRKVNIGHYETVDIYMGVTIPLANVDVLDMDDLKAAVSKAAAEGFMMASKETGDRYQLIKEAVNPVPQARVESTNKRPTTNTSGEPDF